MGGLFSTKVGLTEVEYKTELDKIKSEIEHLQQQKAWIQQALDGKLTQEKMDLMEKALDAQINVLQIKILRVTEERMKNWLTEHGPGDQGSSKALCDRF